MATLEVTDDASSERARPENGAAELCELRRVLKVACKGMAVGAGLHAGIKLIAGITSGKLKDRYTCS